MPTPPDPTGRPSSASFAVPGPLSDAPGATPPGGALPRPPRTGSTGSHNPAAGDSDFVLTGSSDRRKASHESDIAQFLAQPLADNTDDAPTVITHSSHPNAPAAPPVSLPVVVTAGAPSVAGRRLGHFELIEAVGAGGMAAVLKARDTELGRVVALKILPPEAARDPESVNRFKQEARAAAALDHENIARVYFCGEDQGLHFIAFEFVEGVNLRQMIDRRGTLPPAECVRYMVQVAAGLNHAAERGVVHRDIKPSNILVTPDRRAKIVDMGLARHLGSESVNGGVTQSGVTLGTFDYISPEQALDPRRADVRSDIYSLGCTFYHALTGRPPVPEGTAARKLRAHQSDEPLDPRELNPAIPDELAAVLARMMAKDPADRYQTPRELIAHLKGLAARLGLDADPVEHDRAARAVPAETRLLPEAPRFQPLWAVAVAAVAVAAVAFVVATGNPGPAPGAPILPEVRPSPEPAVAVKDQGTPAARAAAGAGAPVKTVEELAERLENPADPATTRVVLEPGDYDLTRLDRPVAFRGQSLELAAAPGSPAGAVRVTVAAGHDRDNPPPGSLTLKVVGKLTVRNVWFDLRLDPKVAVGGFEVYGRTEPVGLRIDGAAAVDLSDCVFATPNDDPDWRSHKPRSVAVDRAGGCALKLLRCLFAPSFVGVALPAGSQATVTDSGFAPHAAAILVADGGGVPRESAVRLGRSTFMLNPAGGAAVEAGKQPNLHVTASDCVFAAADGAPFRPDLASSSAARRGVVIRTGTDSPEGLHFEVPPGGVNAFYEVDAVGTPQATIPFERCKEEAPGIDVKGRAALQQLPWAARKPLESLASLRPWTAFALKVEGPDVDERVFTKEAVPGGYRRVPLGAAFHNPESNGPDDKARLAYPSLTVVWGTFPLPKKPAEVRRVWWPAAAAEDLMQPGVYRNLDALLDDVRPGDVVLIRHNGELPRDTVELKPRTKPADGEFRITIRPDVDCKPVLTVDANTKLNQTLFKLMGGEVTFEEIHFRLRPHRPDAGQTVAAVALLGGKRCAFQNCVFTLAEEDDSRVAAVHLPNIGKEMAMTPAARQTPAVVFRNCLVRGKGRCVWAEVSRPVGLEISDTLTAIDGPLILAEAGGTNVGNGGSRAQLTRVTALAGGPLVEMRGGKTSDAMRPGGLAKIEVEADACLFAAVPNAGRPLVEIDGVDPADWRAVLNWRVPKGNRYANFDPTAALALIKPGTEDGMPAEWGRSQWINKVGEELEGAKRFGEVTFAAPVAGLKDLAAVKPADVAIKMASFGDLTGLRVPEVGADPADLQNRLKGLLEEVKPE
jgi:predicted Ser/Thr protein kinase